MKPLRFLVADNYAVPGKNVRAILLSRPDRVPAGQARNGRTPVARTQALTPDVIVMDIRMPRLKNLGTTLQVAPGASAANILVLTVHESEALVRQVLNARARGRLLKTGAGSDLLKALNALRRDPALLAPGVKPIAPDQRPGKNGKARNAMATDCLTPRQRQILRLLAEGNTSRQAGLTLGLSIKTVETHRSHIMTRLNCHSISELVRYAIRNHIIDA